MPHTSDAELKAHLDFLYRKYGAAFLHSDPICFPRRLAAREDREVIGLLAACLAYGRVPQIQASIGRLAAVMGPSPARFIERFDPHRDRGLLRGFFHRFNDARDIGLLFSYMGQMIREFGSIESFFLEGYAAADDDIGPALSSFARRALALDGAPWYRGGKLPSAAGVRFLLPSPEDGSTCKRLNLFLRWMVRPDDGVDFGLWRGVSPSQLVIPLDTHVSRIARKLGLTSRRTANWKMAVEVTRRLRRMDPQDPVKYDFALSRLGILEGCPKHRAPGRCEWCDLATAGATA